LYKVVLENLIDDEIFYFWYLAIFVDEKIAHLMNQMYLTEENI